MGAGFRKMKNLSKLFTLILFSLLLSCGESQKEEPKFSYQPELEKGFWWVTGKTQSGWESRDKIKSRYRKYEVEIVDSLFVGVGIHFTNSPRLNRKRAGNVRYSYFLDRKTAQVLQLNRIDEGKPVTERVGTNNLGIFSLSPFVMRTDEIPVFPQFPLEITKDYSDTTLAHLPYVKNGYASVSSSQLFQQVRPIAKKDFEQLIDRTLKEQNAFPDTGYVEVYIFEKISTTVGKLYRQVWHPEIPFYLFSRIQSVNFKEAERFQTLVEDKRNRLLITEWLVEFKRDKSKK